MRKAKPSNWFLSAFIKPSKSHTSLALNHLSLQSSQKKSLRINSVPNKKSQSQQKHCSRYSTKPPTSSQPHTDTWQISDWQQLASISRGSGDDQGTLEESPYCTRHSREALARARLTIPARRWMDGLFGVTFALFRCGSAPTLQRFDNSERATARKQSPLWRFFEKLIKRRIGKHFLCAENLPWTESILLWLTGYTTPLLRWWPDMTHEEGTTPANRLVDGWVHIVALLLQHLTWQQSVINCLFTG